MKIAAVVVTYNRKVLLSECLDALLRQTRPLDSIIVIDNASTDGTEEFLKQNYLHKSVFDYVCLPENMGGAGGFYEGVKRGYEQGFDWLWLMDDDVILNKDALEMMSDQHLFKNPKVGALLPVTYGIDGKIHLIFFFKIRYLVFP